VSGDNEGEKARLPTRMGVEQGDNDGLPRDAKAAAA
jgi:hypothetical protein